MTVRELIALLLTVEQDRTVFTSDGYEIVDAEVDGRGDVYLSDKELEEQS